jgi:hypothetical protein
VRRQLNAADEDGDLPIHRAFYLSKPDPGPDLIGLISPGRESHSGTTLYSLLAILHAKYTG